MARAFLPPRFVAALAASLLAGTAAAQEPPAPEPSVRWSAQAALAMYGTGDAVNCGYLPSLTVGMEARTTGTWFAAVSGDVYLPLGAPCADVGTLVGYGDGRYAYDDTRVFFVFAPRLAVHGGRAFAAGDLRVEPAAGAGALLAYDDAAGAATLDPWAGGSLVVRRPGARLSFRGELGWHRIPARHELHERDAQGNETFVETRRFHRWEPLAQLGVRLTF